MAEADWVSSFDAKSLTAAAGTAALDGATLTNLDGRLVVDGSVAHALLDLAGHGQEGLLNVGCVLGRSLEEGNAEAVGEFLFSSISTRTGRVGSRSGKRTFATLYSTTFLSVISLLLPTRSLLTPSVA